MKRVLLAALVQVLVAGHVSAAGWSHKSGTTAPTATVSPRSATPLPVCAKLQPIVGSVQRTSHFTNPFTHQAKYSYGTYNPVSGQFGTNTFRR